MDDERKPPDRVDLIDPWFVMALVILAAGLAAFYFGWYADYAFSYRR